MISVGSSPRFRHRPMIQLKRSTKGGMKRGLPAFLVASLAVFVAGCEGTAANGACSTTMDVGAKISVLTDDLKQAQASGQIDAATAGAIGAEILAAGAKFGSGKNPRGYCEA